MGGGAIELFFYPVLTAAEKQSLKEAMPPFVKHFYDVTSEELQFDTEKGTIVE